MGTSPVRAQSLGETAAWLAEYLPRAGTFRHVVSRDHADAIYGFRLTRATLRNCELQISGSSYVIDVDIDTHERDSSQSSGIVAGTARLSTVDPQHVTIDKAPTQIGARWADDLWYVTLYRSDGQGQALAIAIASEDIAEGGRQN